MEQKQVRREKIIQKITVIGQGGMGPDIALSMALAGFQVTCVDLSRDILDGAAQKTILTCQQMVEGELLTEEQGKNAQARIIRSMDWDASVADADFVTEAVPEVMTLKQDIFTRCDALCSPEVIIASNTSTMSITRIAEKMKYPGRAITTHWTIPAHLLPLVEVVVGEQTAPETKELTFSLLRKMGKHPVLCQDTPGFIHNYLQSALVGAALELLENQVASPEEIDGVVKYGFGLRLPNVGPLQFLDMVGLDTALNAGEYLYETTKNPAYKPAKAITEKVKRGDLGVKSGKGFYVYEAAGSVEFSEKSNKGLMRMLKAQGYNNNETT